MAVRYDSFDPFSTDRQNRQSLTKQDRLQQMVKQLQDEGRVLHPAKADGKKIAKSFWGYSWVRHIESYQDYESRLPRGRSLLRNNAVLDLTITGNQAEALVFDQELYEIRIIMEPVDPAQLKQIQTLCAGKINSLLDLIQGNLSEDILQILSDPEKGLFPRYDEIRFICNCLDDSILCKHAAAVLYGIGPVLDQKPDLFFSLRGIDYSMLFSGIDAEKITDDPQTSDQTAAFHDIDLEKTFGIELDPGISDLDLDELLNGK